MDEFHHLIQLGEEGSTLVYDIAYGFLMIHKKGKRILDKFSDDDVLIPPSESFERVRRFFRCVCHLLGKNADSPTDHKDVYWITEYQGNQLFERTMKSVLTKPTSWWNAQVVEVVKTAGKAPLMQPKLEVFQAKLDKNPSDISTPELEEMVAMYQELRMGLRTNELKPLADKFKKVISHFLKHMVGLSARDASRVSSAHGYAIINGLDLFASEPGILSRIKEAQTWMTEHRGTLSAHDLADAMRSVAEDSKKLDVERIKKLISRVPQQFVNEAMNDIADAFFLSMLRMSLDKDSGSHI